MVLNDTRVLPAELRGVRPPRSAEGEGVEVTLTLLERRADGSWKAFARPTRRLREGDILAFGEAEYALRVNGKEEDGAISVVGTGGLSIEAIMERHGGMPLPPYISRIRPADEKDLSDYQTVYASQKGAVAAPTAGLHFTPELLDRITAKGVETALVTLHVGAGTFLPVKSEDIAGHLLHEEWCEISEGAADRINKSRANGGRILAVGTTSLRLLETAAGEDGSIKPYRGSTELFIKPGHRFRSADMLLTNFHLPKSTLFMLVCAFSGVALMKKAYAHALASGFRFYSYGDACLLYPASESFCS